MNLAKLFTVAVPLALVLAGCATATPNTTGAAPVTKQVPIVVIHEQAFTNCPAYSPARSLTVYDRQTWADHVRTAVLQPSRLAQWNPDFDRSTTLRFTLGQKPTLGYGVQSAAGIQVVNQELRIPVQLSVPAQGAIVGQALTDPCVYLHVTGVDYKAVSIVDAKTQTVLMKAAR